MKRCPKCNQTFSESWLSFCTQDGTTLIDDSVAKSEPPPTIMSSGPPPPVSAPQANWNQPSGGFGSAQFPEPQYQAPQPIQAGWQPPPPPAYVAGPRQGLAVASLICGIFTITLGWCYVGVISGPVAIILGIISLVQIRNDPAQHTGKPMAIAGIVTGSLYFVLIGIFILFAIAMQGMK
ncbi:MAG TPA: DUF4190 domain-containing protein [Pyrinomonadaceae bacterium]